MGPVIIDGLIILGSLLMVRNIYRYALYVKHIQEKGEWRSQKLTLFVPMVLLVFFLIGYLFVAFYGHPDVMMSLILFFGSVFVAVIVGTLQKITKHIQENGLLEAKLMAAEESNRAKTGFLSNMSHEIRTPMNAIIGIDALALKDPEMPPHAREQFEKIDASARHLLSLINDVLDMSRIESGRMELREELFDLEDMLGQVSGIIESQCSDKGLKYVFNSSDLPGGSYYGDDVKLKQVLINILGNSVKFTPAGGTVSLTAEKVSFYGDRCAMRFVIEDNGIGMDKEFIPKIFEPFSQEDASNTNRYGGSGLGMSLTKSIVDMMNGDIQVSSEKGKGSRFTVSVTLKAAPHGQVPAEPQDESAGAESSAEAGTAAAQVSLAGKRVLIAEDIEMNAEILRDLLEMEDIESEWAENGQIAVDMFRNSGERHFDAILMDMRMPVMDGLSAARAIRATGTQEAKTIPIIALTANAFEEDVQHSLQAGMNAHLSKPVDPDLLVATLSELMINGLGDSDR